MRLKPSFLYRLRVQGILKALTFFRSARASHFKVQYGWHFSEVFPLFITSNPQHTTPRGKCHHLNNSFFKKVKLQPSLIQTFQTISMWNTISFAPIGLSTIQKKEPFKWTLIQEEFYKPCSQQTPSKPFQQSESSLQYCSTNSLC